MKNYAAYPLFASLLFACGGSSEEFESIGSAMGSDDESGFELASGDTDSEGLLSSPPGGAYNENSTVYVQSEAERWEFPGLSLSGDYCNCGYAAPAVDPVKQEYDGRGQPQHGQYQPPFGGVPVMMRTLSTCNYPSEYASVQDDLSGLGIVYPERVRAVYDWTVINALGLIPYVDHDVAPTEIGEDISNLLPALESEGIYTPPLNPNDEEEKFQFDIATDHVAVEPVTHVKQETGHGSLRKRKEAVETTSFATAEFYPTDTQAVKKPKLEGQNAESELPKDSEPHRTVQQAVEYTTFADDDTVDHVTVERRWLVNYSLNDDMKNQRSIQMVTIVDALGNRLTLARGVDVARVVERQSNINRMFGKYDSPSEKIKLTDLRLCGLTATFAKRAGPTNYLTESGVKRLLTHTKLTSNPVYSAFLKNRLLAQEFSNASKATPQ